MNPTVVRDGARAAVRARLCVLPVKSDGTKAPDVPSWIRFKKAPPASADLKAFRFDTRIGYGMISGAVSGNREAWDFDELATYEAFRTHADASGLGEIVRRIEAGYCDETPNGGRRWIVEYPEGTEFRDVTLARRPGLAGEPKIKTLIELPTFAILAPSYGAVHPTGRPYIRRSGGFDTIARYTCDERNDLLALARSFDAMPAATSTHGARVDQGSHRPGTTSMRGRRGPTSSRAGRRCIRATR